MSSQPIDGFVLYINDTVVSVHASLDEAFSAGDREIQTAGSPSTGRIVSASSRVLPRGGATPATEWNYAADIRRWLVRAAS